VIAGLGVAVLAAFAYETGYVLQVLEAREGDRAHGLRPRLLVGLARRPRWLTGTALSVAGAGLQVLALTLAPLTVVQPTLALGLVLLLVLATVVLHERVGRREWTGVVAIVIGVTGIALAAPPLSPPGGHGFGLALLMTALGVLTALPFLLRRRWSDARVALVGAAAGDAGAALALKVVADSLRDGLWVVALALAIGAAIAGLLALTAEMTALQRLPATRVAPVILAAQIVVPVLAAPVLLSEHWDQTPLGGAVLAAAVATVTAGAGLLAASGPVGEVVALGRGRSTVRAGEDRLGGRRQRRE
jgi:drug/metabolite transporter (DMT)-like permease